MKIAMIHTPILGRGGGERQILRLALELQRMGNEVEIFVSALSKQSSYPDMIEKLTVNVIPHPLEKKLPKWLNPRHASEVASGQTKTEGKSALREYMRRNLGRQIYTIPYELPAMINIGRKIPKGFDIINNHNYPSEWAAFYAKKNLKAPVVWMCNEPPFWFFVPELRKGLRKINWPVYNIIDRVTVDYADEILVLSNIAKGYVNQAYKRNAHVVRSGVDTEIFHRAKGEKIREKYGLGKDFVLLQVGNIELNKRQSDTLKALQILSKRHDRIHLILDGSGRREEITALAEKLGVKDKLLIIRSSTEEELAEVYATCDAFIFPAQITWGLAVVEAMAASKPVIVSNKCGVSEIIQTEVNGLVVEHARPEELARNTERLMDDPKLRKQFGDNAYEYVKNNLSWEKFAATMEKIFSQAKARAITY